LGTLLDGIHAYGDVLSYPTTAFGRWAWFVPIEFGLLGLAVGLAAPTIERWAAPVGGVRFAPVERIAELGLFAGLYALTALVGDDQPGILACALAVLALLRLTALGAPGDWIYMVAAAVLGPACEALLVALGVFSYTNPDVAGIPIWLPALWANGGILVRRLIVPIVLPGPFGELTANATPQAADSSSPLRSP
jgi:hypothetical protein